ncbi:hypothetical protein AMTRI_Chr06g201710 [Amborella trichopoda]
MRSHVQHNAALINNHIQNNDLLSQLLIAVSIGVYTQLQLDTYIQLLKYVFIKKNMYSHYHNSTTKEIKLSTVWKEAYTRNVVCKKVLIDKSTKPYTSQSPK